MPLVEIKWFKGRDDATKAITVGLVTKVVCEGYGCSSEAVTVIIQDVYKASWGRGRQTLRLTLFSGSSE